MQERLLHDTIYILSYFPQLTISLDSQTFRNHAILPVSSRKRMTLNKTWLTDNRNPSHRIFLLPIPIHRFIKFSYQNTKRANSCIPIQNIESKNTGGDPHHSHSYELEWYGLPLGNKRLVIPLKSNTKGQLGSSRNAWAPGWVPTNWPFCLPENLFWYSHSVWRTASNTWKPLLPNSGLFLYFFLKFKNDDIHSPS